VISFPPGNGLRIGGTTSGVAVVVAGSVKALVGSDCVGLTVPVPGLTVPVPEWIWGIMPSLHLSDVSQQVVAWRMLVELHRKALLR